MRGKGPKEGSPPSDLRKRGGGFSWLHFDGCSGEKCFDLSTKKGPREFICLSIVYHVLIKLDNNSEIFEERYLQFDQFKAFV